MQNRKYKKMTNNNTFQELSDLWYVIYLYDYYLSKVILKISQQNKKLLNIVKIASFLERFL